MSTKVSHENSPVVSALLACRHDKDCKLKLYIKPTVDYSTESKIDGLKCFPSQWEFFLRCACFFWQWLEWAGRSSRGWWRKWGSKTRRGKAGQGKKLWELGSSRLSSPLYPFDLHHNQYVLGEGDTFEINNVNMSSDKDASSDTISGWYYESYSL